MSDSRCRPDSRMSARYSACLSLISPNMRSASTSEKPMIALSGVRSSCDMLARNSLLCRLAISSCRLLSSISRKSRAFWMASADCVANVLRRSITSGANSPGACPIDDEPAKQVIFAQQRHGEQRAVARAQQHLADAALVDGLVRRCRGSAHGSPVTASLSERALALRDGTRAQRVDDLVGQPVRRVRGGTPRAPRRIRRSTRRPCRRARWRARRSCAARFRGRASSSLPGRPRPAPSAHPPIA